MLSTKKQDDQILSLKLKNEGVITTPGVPLKVLDKFETNIFTAKNGFGFEVYDPINHGNICIFKSRLVREV